MSTTTNGHEPVDGAVRSATAVRWMRPADLPAHLGGGLVAAEVPDESAIWGEHMPDPEALAAAVDRAERVVKLQDLDVLAKAKSDEDVRHDLAAARVLRTLERERELEQQKETIAEARARDAHERRLRELGRRAEQRAAEAGLEAAAVSNPHTEVVRLPRARRWVPLLAAVPAVFSLIAGAVNVGAELTRIFPGTPLIAWVVDPIITLAIVAIMFAHLYGAAKATNGKNPYLAVEVLLFVLTSAAAVGLHYVDGPTPEAKGSGDGALIWLFVPIGLGVSLWLVPKLRSNLTARLVEAHAEAQRHDRDKAREEVRPTVSDLHGKNPDTPSSRTARKKRREEVTATIPAPPRTSLESHRATLRDLASRGEIDPATTPVNTVAKRLGCRWERARDLLAELATENQPTTRDRTGEHA